MRKAENLKGNGERTKRRGICRTECYIKGDLRKTKLLKYQKRFFWLPGNQLKLLGNSWHIKLLWRTKSRSVRHPCLWQMILAVGMSWPWLLLPIVQKCLQVMQWEVQEHIWNVPQKPALAIWETKHPGHCTALWPWVSAWSWVSG